MTPGTIKLVGDDYLFAEYKCLEDEDKLDFSGRAGSYFDFWHPHVEL